MRILKSTRGLIIAVSLIAACIMAVLIGFGVGPALGFGLFIAIGVILELLSEYIIGSPKSK